MKKKIFGIILSAVMAISLVACAGQSTKNSLSKSKESSTAKEKTSTNSQNKAKTQAQVEIKLEKQFLNYHLINQLKILKLKL